MTGCSWDVHKGNCAGFAGTIIIITGLVDRDHHLRRVLLVELARMVYHVLVLLSLRHPRSHSVSAYKSFGERDRSKARALQTYPPISKPRPRIKGEEGGVGMRTPGMLCPGRRQVQHVHKRATQRKDSRKMEVSKSGRTGSAREGRARTFNGFATTSSSSAGT